MSDKRCGTCRHYRPASYSTRIGTCGVEAFLRNAQAPTSCDDGDGCPGWSDGDDYARGWRDAVAAAAQLAEELTHGDDLLRGLGRAIAALTPPG